MKLSMRIVTVALMVGLAVAACATEQDLLNRAKLLLFDQKWEQALDTLDTFLDTNPPTNEAAQAMYYRAGCLKELDRHRDAIAAYEDYLGISRNATLREEAVIGIIDLSHTLAQRGDRKAADRLVAYLDHDESTIRYYAAFRLSYARETSLARKAIPVLQRILRTERDTELKERARLALLRIDPTVLKQEKASTSVSGSVLKIRVVEKGSGEAKVSVTIPLALARLALSALPQEEKDRLAEEGYDLDSIMDLMVQTGEMIRIEDEEATIRIWIEKSK